MRTNQATPYNFLVEQGDYHLHTNWTDGKNSVVEMYRAACEAGLKQMLFSEHVSSKSDTWFGRFAEEVRNLPEKPCKAYVGAEARIASFEGGIIIPDCIRDECDLIIGSVHRFCDKKGAIIEFSDVNPSEALDIELRLIQGALDKGGFDILGHPCGMSFQRYDSPPDDNQLRAIMKKVKDHGIAFEISSCYHPDPINMLKLCNEVGVIVSPGSDAHSIKSIGEISKILKAGSKS
jgi:putative hydrolase